MSTVNITGLRAAAVTLNDAIAASGDVQAFGIQGLTKAVESYLVYGGASAVPVGAAPVRANAVAAEIGAYLTAVAGTITVS